MGIDLETSVTAKVGGKFNGIGVIVTDATDVVIRSFGAFHSLANVFPVLKDCLQEELTRFGPNDSAAAFRNPPVGSVRITETSGSVKFKGSESSQPSLAFRLQQFSLLSPVMMSLKLS